MTDEFEALEEALGKLGVTLPGYLRDGLRQQAQKRQEVAEKATQALRELPGHDGELVTPLVVKLVLEAAETHAGGGDGMMQVRAPLALAPERSGPDDIEIGPISVEVRQVRRGDKLSIPNQTGPNGDRYFGVVTAIEGVDGGVIVKTDLVPRGIGCPEGERVLVERENGRESVR